MNFLKQFQYYLFAAAIGVLLIALGVQTVRLTSSEADLAIEKQERAEDKALRADAVTKELQRQAKAKEEHDDAIAAKDAEYEKLKADNKKRAASAAADNDRLRSQIAAYASGSRRPDESAESLAKRLADRSSTLGSLLAESLELSAEGEEIISRRDGEVKRLLDQITIDRSACSPS